MHQVENKTRRTQAVQLLLQSAEEIEMVCLILEMDMEAHLRKEFLMQNLHVTASCVTWLPLDELGLF